MNLSIPTCHLSADILYGWKHVGTRARAGAGRVWVELKVKKVYLCTQSDFLDCVAGIGIGRVLTALASCKLHAKICTYIRTYMYIYCLNVLVHEYVC